MKKRSTLITFLTAIHLIPAINSPLNELELQTISYHTHERTTRQCCLRRFCKRCCYECSPREGRCCSEINDQATRELCCLTALYNPATLACCAGSILGIFFCASRMI